MDCFPGPSSFNFTKCSYFQLTDLENSPTTNQTKTVNLAGKLARTNWGLCL